MNSPQKQSTLNHSLSSPQMANKILNIQTKVFSKGSSLRDSPATSQNSNSEVNSPSDPNLLSVPADSFKVKYRSPKGVSVISPTPIYKEIDDIATFRKRTNTCIIGSNGKEYHQHWTAHFCTGSDEIEGIMTIDHGSLVFKATCDLEGSVKRSGFGKLLPFLSKPKQVYTKTFADFEVDINLQDIAECHIMDFPIPNKHSQKIEKVYLLQLCLTNHGKLSLEPGLDEILAGMKVQKIPYLTVFFNIRPEGEEIVPEGPSETLIKILSKIEDTIASLPEGRVSELATDVPYFDFMIEKFPAEQRPLLRAAKQTLSINLKQKLITYKESAKSPKQKLKASKLKSKSTTDSNNNSPSVTSPTVKPKRHFIPTILDQSNIVTFEQFGQLISCVPDLYQMFEWDLLYSNSIHGTSFNNLMRRSIKANPFIVIIRDINDSVFGAYGSEALKPAMNYYGTGETFVFTFRKSTEITAYNWSKKNDLFIFANEDGIMFGAGPFYGLWIGNDLTRGRTYTCDTFDNQPLSNTTDFEIAKIEVWSVIDPFSKK